MRNSLLKRVKKDGFEEHDITMALWIVQYKKSNITNSFFFGYLLWYGFVLIDLEWSTAIYCSSL